MKTNGNGHHQGDDEDNIHVLPAVGLVRVDELTQLNDRLTELFKALERNKEVQLKLRHTVRLTMFMVSAYFVFVLFVLFADFYTNLWHH